MILLNNDISKHCIFLDETESTNNVAKLLISKNTVVNGTCIIAENQTAGKGQINATWESEAYKNITLSYIFDLQFLKIDKIFLWNKCIANAIHRCVSHFLPNEKNEIKWPNDIIVNNKKISGVLIENTLTAAYFSWSVVGIGINVNQMFFSTAPNAISFKNIIKKDFEKEVVIAYLHTCIENAYNLMIEEKWTEIEDYYTLHLYKKGEKSSFLIQGEVKQGQIKFVDEYGRLVVEIDGRINTFGVKEILFI